MWQNDATSKREDEEAKAPTRESFGSTASVYERLRSCITCQTVQKSSELLFLKANKMQDRFIHLKGKAVCLCGLWQVNTGANKIEQTFSLLKYTLPVWALPVF